MSAPRSNHARWFKSSRSAANGACVEVAIDCLIGVRDSKDPQGPILEFTQIAWTAFARSIREGHFGK